ncbi:MAG: DHA2 family efflux MFS transporter permease subunit [Methanomicrobiaceae archaeon]|nr:DHA2 family efflux MFS transporter permease subunit [Methanomicrobiaceae archaeon]
MNSNKTTPAFLILLVVGIGAFMDGLDGAIVNVSLPQIASGFNAELGLASLVVTVYLVALSAFMIIFAKSSAFIGIKKIYTGGLLLFTISSVFCAASWNIETLIAFRALQGLGAAMIAPSAIATVAIHIKESERAKSLGIIAAASALAFAIGPVAGGFITEFLSWHWIFLINIPIGIAGIILAKYILPEDTPKPFRKAEFDYAGSILFIIAMTFFILPLGFLGGKADGILNPAYLLIISAVFFILFISAEKKAKDPVIDLVLFFDKNFTYSTISYSVAMLSYGGLILMLPFYFEYIMGMSPGKSGLFLLIPSVLITILSPIGGHIADKNGARLICFVSSAVFLVSFIVILATFGLIEIFWAVLALIIMGIGLGPFMSAGSSRIIEHSDADKKEMASGIMSTSIYFGTALGTALFTAIFGFFSGGAGLKEGTGITVAAFMTGFNSAITAGILFCLIIVITAYLARDKLKT